MPTIEWIGKEKVINHHQEVPYRVLKRKYGFSINTELKNETDSGNKIIHGDNVEALKSLLPEYENRIKCIYIDPPYNTGNEGWIYNDNVNHPKIKKWLGEVVGKEGEDLSRHDKWLCMMYPRLKLLHKLLSDDGVIFISIDDNEQSNLKLIMDEIFGMSNFIATIPWQSRTSKQNDTDISINHEYIVVYAKKRRKTNRRLKESNKDLWHSKDSFAFYPLKLDKSKFSNPDNDIRGLWKADPFDAPNIRPNLTYEIINPNTNKVFLPPKGRCWRTEKSKYIELLNDNRIVFGKNGTSKPQLKVFYNEKVELGEVSDSWFSGTQYGTTTQGTKTLQKIFNVKYNFDHPKPHSLLEYLFKLSTDENSIILDSFAGSGTTAHAVLNLNKEESSNRKFILIEMEDYSENITAERVKRVINGYADIEGTGGEFDFCELGEQLFINNILNESIDIQDIRKYVYYTETKQQLTTSNKTNNQYFLGSHNNSDYYFYYEKNKLTILNYQFLSTIDKQAEQYLIYADKCTIDSNELAKKNIIFKKIPRDIARF